MEPWYLRRRAVIQEVLADAEARLEGDSPEAALLALAVEAEQMTIHRPAGP